MPTEAQLHAAQQRGCKVERLLAESHGLGVEEQEAPPPPPNPEEFGARFGEDVGGGAGQLLPPPPAQGTVNSRTGGIASNPAGRPRLIQQYVLALLFANFAEVEGERWGGRDAESAHFMTALHECHWAKSSLVSVFILVFLLFYFIYKELTVIMPLNLLDICRQISVLGIVEYGSRWC